METNFYNSYHTSVKRLEYSKITSGPGISEDDRMQLQLEQAERQRRALELLFGGKIQSSKGKTDAFSHSLDSAYVDYSNLKPSSVTVTKMKVEYVDNSGPCTANIEVDSSIDLDFYINQAKMNNQAYIDSAGDELTFFSLENYNSVADAYKEALIEKYTYLRQEALQHANPELYIEEKYNNPKSPFYASDLTDIERRIAYNYEKDMLKDGTITGVSFQDSLFRGTVLNAGANVGDERRFNRKVMNTQLNNILSNSGISIPEGVALRCTINPKTCYISITDNTGDGVERKDLCSAVESALNVKENGINLYRHIMQSSYSAVDVESSQYVYEGRIKFQYYHNTDGNSMGMDGDYNQKFKAYCDKYYYKYSEKAAEVGFDGFMDMYLSIDITSAGFQDAFQNVNWSNDSDELIAEWLSESTYSTL